MKNIAWLLIGISLVIGITLAIGCSNANQHAQSHDQNTESHKSARDRKLEKAKHYVQSLAELRNQAVAFESSMNFAGASKTWEKIEQQLVQDFGANSWQAINAKIAVKSSRKRMQLSEEHAAELKEIHSLQEQIKDAFQNQDNPTALVLSQKLLNLQQPLFGDVSMETARLLLQIGTLETRLGRIDPAIRNLHRSVEIFRNKGIELHPELETAMASLAEAYTRKQKFRPAVANQKGATRIAGHLWGKESLQYANQANQLGVLFHRAGNDQVATEILTAAKKLREQQLGKDSIEYAHSCLNLGIVSLSQRKLLPAEEQLNLASSVFQKKLGPQNEFTIRCKSELATIMMLQNRPESTVQLLSEIVDALPAERQDETADYQYKLAIALARLGKYKQAEPMLDRVLSTYQSRHGVASKQAIKAMKGLAKLFEATHQKTKLKNIHQQLNQTSRVAESNDFHRRF